MRKRQFLFRLFYSTSFTVLLILEILLLLISPGDIIYQSFAAGRTLSIIAVAIVYVAVLLVSAFIIATRFYTAHTQLTSIPKSHIPIRKNDLGKSLRRLVTSELSRSASIAYHAHPRPVRYEDLDTLARENTQTKSKTITWSLDHMKSWQEIRHAGWSSPCATPLPDLQFEQVVLEFPHLIEAKAVSLAPPDPLVKSDISSIAHGDMADQRALQLIQRPASMSLRRYINRLEDLGMLNEEVATHDFLSVYEVARFAKDPISEPDFRSMLESFTRIVENLIPPSEITLEEYYAQTPGLSTVSSRSLLYQESSVNTAQRAAIKEDASTSTQHLSHARGIVSDDQPTPISESHTPFLTPRPYMYPPSLSSGHAGDRSSNSSDSESEPSVRTKPSRSGRLPKRTNGSRYGSTSASARQTTGLFEHSASPRQERSASEDNGSVIRKIASNLSQRSGLSYRSNASYATGESVIHRSEEREPVLPLPMADSSR